MARGADPPLELSIASTPDASTDPSDAETTVSAVPAGGTGAVGAAADPPLELTIASKPGASSDPSDVKMTVSAVPEDVREVSLPSEPLKRPSRAPLVLSPSYTVMKSYELSVFICLICMVMVEVERNIHRQF